MKAEAAEAGFFQTKSLAGANTSPANPAIEELLSGKKIDMPVARTSLLQAGLKVKKGQKATRSFHSRPRM
jgi:hypothetical protein